MSQSSIHEVANLLQDHPMFAALTQRELTEVAGMAEVLMVEQGDVVMQEGMDGNAFFLLQSGELRVSVGGKFVSTLRPGACIGEMAVIDAGPRTATVTATRSSELLCFERTRFEELLAADSLAAHKVVLSLAKVVVQRFRQTLAQAAGPLPADVTQVSFVMRQS